MKGIDISRWNAWPFNDVTENGYQDSDFVIVKATQGTSYSRTDYFEKAIERVLADGKLGGAYHYAAGGDAKKEADYFLKIVKPYIGKIVLALDWERGDNKAWGSKSWPEIFCERIKEKTGAYPLIYTGMEGAKHCAACADHCPLWFCGYPVNANSWDVPAWPRKYTTAPWSEWTIWQYTSGRGRLDRNTTMLKKTDWAKLIGGAKTSTTAPAPVAAANKSTLDLAVEVMQGVHGSGAARKRSLGASYTKVQNLINYIAVAPTATLAREVLAGKYGNGDQRKIVLGRRYNAVQRLVNRLI